MYGVVKGKGSHLRRNFFKGFISSPKFAIFPIVVRVI
jgi:hypothetical protein